MASSDTDDDIIVSKLSALLIASTLYQRRQVNVRKCNFVREIHVHVSGSHSAATEREIDEV